MQNLRLGFGLFSLLAGDGKGIALHFDGDVLGRETGNRHGDAVFILGCALDIVGRIARRIEGRGFIQHAGEAVKTDGGAIEGGKIKHGHILLEQCHLICPPQGPGSCFFRGAVDSLHLPPDREGSLRFKGASKLNAT